MVELWRGGLLESTHSGHAVIWGPDGIEDSWGDPAAVIFPRSSCKMIQALPLIETGAADALGLTPAHLAMVPGLVLCTVVGLYQAFIYWTQPVPVEEIA